MKLGNALTPQIFDPGNVQEFFITHIVVEPVTDSDCLRVYACASRSAGTLVLQYTVIIPRHRLIEMGKQIDAACEAHPALLAFVPDMVPS